MNVVSYPPRSSGVSPWRTVAVIHEATALKRSWHSLSWRARAVEWLWARKKERKQEEEGRRESKKRINRRWYHYTQSCTAFDIFWQNDHTPNDPLNTLNNPLTPLNTKRSIWTHRGFSHARASNSYPGIALNISQSIKVHCSATCLRKEESNNPLLVVVSRSIVQPHAYRGKEDSEVCG